MRHRSYQEEQKNRLQASSFNNRQQVLNYKESVRRKANSLTIKPKTFDVPTEESKRVRK